MKTTAKVRLSKAYGDLYVILERLANGGMQVSLCEIEGVMNNIKPSLKPAKYPKPSRFDNGYSDEG